MHLAHKYPAYDSYIGNRCMMANYNNQYLGYSNAHTCIHWAQVSGHGKTCVGTCVQTPFYELMDTLNDFIKTRELNITDPVSACMHSCSYTWGLCLFMRVSTLTCMYGYAGMHLRHVLACAQSCMHDACDVFAIMYALHTPHSQAMARRLRKFFLFRSRPTLLPLPPGCCHLAAATWLLPPA